MIEPSSSPPRPADPAVTGDRRAAGPNDAEPVDADPSTTGASGPVPADVRPRTRGNGRASRVLGALVVLTVAVGTAALGLASVASHTLLVVGLLVVGPVALTTAPLVLMTGVAGIALLALLVARERGRPRTGVIAAVVGTTLGLVVPLLLAVPLVGFFALGSVLAAADALRPGPVAVLLAGLGTGAALVSAARDRRPAGTATPRRGATLARHTGTTLGALLVGAAATALTTITLSARFMAVDDDVVVARHPGGCTAVVEQTRFMVGGDAMLFLAPPGSSVARLHSTYHLAETSPYDISRYVLEPGPAHVTIAFDDGRDGVDEVVGCG